MFPDGLLGLRLHDLRHTYAARLLSVHLGMASEQLRQATDAYVCRLLPLTCLAPDIVEAVLDARKPKGLKLAALPHGIPLASEELRRAFGSCGTLLGRGCSRG